MRRKQETGDVYIRRFRKNRHYMSCAAGIIVLALLAGALAGCGSGETGNISAVQGQNSQAEESLKESQESDGKENNGKRDGGDSSGEEKQQQGDSGNTGSGTEKQQSDGGNTGNGTEKQQGDSRKNNSDTAAFPVVEDGRITIGDTTVSLEPDDEYISWAEDSPVMIHLDDSGIAIEGQGAKAEGSTVTIEKSGTYVLNGSLSDGTILVDAGDDGKVRLVFDGVDIHSETSAPVDIKKAGKTVISLEEGSANSLSDSPNLIYRNEEKEEPNGALFSKGDLTINGSGTLKVTGTFNNGIGSKDVLKIVGGTLEVTAANHGVKGNDALVIYDGQLTIAASGDGVKSDILAAVLGGDILISECDEGIEAENIVIHGGTIDLTSSDDGINASTDETNTPQMYFMGGTVTVRAEGDGIDSNGSIHMSGGRLTVYGPSGRDNGALDYDREFNLTGGTIMAFGPGGMEQNVSSAQSQVSVLADFGETLAAGTEVTLRDQNGKELCKATGEKDFRTVVITAPEMVTGGEYEIQAGENVIAFAPEKTIIYVNKDGIQEAAAMGPGWGGPGGRGGRMNGGREGQPGERPEPPEDWGGRPGERPQPPEDWEGRPGERPESPEDQKGQPEGGRNHQKDN